MIPTSIDIEWGWNMLRVIIRFSKQFTQLPNITSAEFPFLPHLKIDIRMFFLWKAYKRGRNNRTGFASTGGKARSTFHVLLFTSAF